jgi:hypothetical protein
MGSRDGDGIEECGKSKARRIIFGESMFYSGVYP